jgi:hypothetical protein
MEASLQKNVGTTNDGSLAQLNHLSEQCRATVLNRLGQKHPASPYRV